MFGFFLAKKARKDTANTLSCTTEKYFFFNSMFWA